MRDEVKRVALFGSGVAELTKQRAERIVKDLVGAGDVRKSQAAAVVKDLLESSRENRKELMRFVSVEVQAQMESLGFATKRDLERMERRITRLEAEMDSAGKRNRKTTRKRSTAKKTTAQRTAAQRGGATKPPLPESSPTT
jgi:polyhydroxyalkanoate synthesis regulator phasin